MTVNADVHFGRAGNVFALVSSSSGYVPTSICWKLRHGSLLGVCLSVS